MIRIFDKKLKKISGMRYRLETSCMDSSWKNSRHVFFWGGGNYLPL